MNIESFLNIVGLGRLHSMVELSLYLNKRLDVVKSMRWEDLDHSALDSATSLILRRISQEGGHPDDDVSSLTGFMFDHVERRAEAASDLFAALPDIEASMSIRRARVGDSPSIEDSEQYIILFGEGRPNDRPQVPLFTRLCDDPWNYIEVSARGTYKPCCVMDVELRRDEIGGTTRNSAYMRALRGELLTGNLGPRCATCHIRKKVSIEEFHQHRNRTGYGGADLDAWPLANLRVDLNEKCNLRCVYCPVSNGHYTGTEMTPETMAEVLGYIRSLPSETQILCNGHGETTFHKDWRRFCDAMLEDGQSATTGLSDTNGWRRTSSKQSRRLRNRPRGGYGHTTLIAPPWRSAGAPPL